MNAASLEKYADLLLHVGVNLQPGQNLTLSSEPVHWDFINLLSARAYQLGARHVEAQIQHPAFGKMRVDHSAEEHLTYNPAYLPGKFDEHIRDGSASIRIEGSEFPDLFQDIDQDRNAIRQKSASEVFKAFREAAGAGQIPWCVAAMPTDAWAQKVFNDKQATATQLWEIMVPILRVDQDDPVATWRRLGEDLQRRADQLSNSGIHQLHFEGPGTDLRIELLDEGFWCGGPITMENGRKFEPNLPTEEVFTSPNFRKTTGRATVTRPVEVLGHEVVGAWFEFKDGNVVDFGAEDGLVRLEKYFEIDPRARALGEIALVDGASPIFQSGKVFHSILYDENAACHMALGSSYSDTYTNGPALSEDERYELGLNQSILHTDFMIGSPEVTVTGKTRDGTCIPIIENGAFSDQFS
jgi:aminopeptidase